MRPVAVITGASRGIGRAAALAFASRGLNVALMSRSPEALDRVAAEVRQLGVTALVVPCDVSVAADVDAARDRVLRDLGGPAVVVANAGVVRRGHVVALSEADWDFVVGVNLKGAFLTARAFLPAMLACRKGRFVAVGSISGTVGTAAQSAYCASKWGVTGLVKSLAEELRGSGVQALCVLPGSVDTDMLAGSGYEPEMTAADVAGLIAYAGLDAPAAMNGSAVEMFGA